MAATELQPMESLGEIYRRISCARVVLPDDSSCPGCGRFDVSRDDVLGLLQAADPDGRLALVLHARCQCAARAEEKKRRAERELFDAHFPAGATPRTLQSFIPREGTVQMVAAAKEYLAQKGPRVLVLVGGFGCGKSHIMEAIGRKWLDRGPSVRYEVAANLLERLRHTYSRDSEEDLFTLLEWYNQRSLLLLDDLGMERATDYAAEQLTRIVNDRLLHWGYLIIATNKTKDELAEHLGDRIASRVYPANPDLGEVKVVINRATDYRSERRNTSGAPR